MEYMNRHHELMMKYHYVNASSKSSITLFVYPQVVYPKSNNTVHTLH